MKKETVSFIIWSLMVAMAGVSGIIIICLDAANTKTKNTEIQKPQEKLYEDDGLGVMIILNCDRSDYVKKAYLQWKRDYPERSQKIIATAVQGHGPNQYFMLIYEINGA